MGIYYEVRMPDGRVVFTDQPHLYQGETKARGDGQHSRSHSGQRPGHKAVRSNAKNALRQKYIAEETILRNKLAETEAKKMRHLRYAEEVGRDYTKMIAEQEKLLNNQKRLEYGFSVAGNLVGFAVALGKCVTQDLKALNAANKQLTASGSRLKNVTKLSWADPTNRIMTETMMEKHLQASATRTLVEKHGKLLLKSRFGEWAGLKVLDTTVQLTTMNLKSSASPDSGSASPFVDAGRILWNLSLGSDPTAVASSALSLYWNVDLDEAKETHKRAIDEMKMTRDKGIAFHKVAAEITDFQIVNLKADLVLLADRYRRELSDLQR